MIGVNSLTKSLVLFALLLAMAIFGGSTILVSPSHPVSTEDENEIAQKYGITFPISELGNCRSISECRLYCEDPVNRDTCINFAKSKGFYKEEEILSEREDEILNAARTELGCQTKSECMEFCHQEENFEKCSAFAEKYNLGGGHVEDPGKAEILEKAKTILGCNSYKSCQNFCSQETNREKCSEFARQVGLRGGEQRVGPGGCTSEETCRAFCSDPNNYQICSGYSSSTGGKFSGPGGCDSEASCREYCEKNPGSCNYVGSSAGSYNPQEMCSKTPNCKWEGNTCQCSDSPSPYPSYRPYPGNNDQSGYEAECRSKSGCSWEGTYCRCDTTGSTSYSPPPSPEPYSTQGGETVYKSECINAGCSWSDFTNSCQCPNTKGVQGATTDESIFQKLLRRLGF